MRLKGFIILLLGVFSACSLFAQSQGELTQSRILILLDESSSMVQPWAGGMEKYKAADTLILRLMDSVYAVNSDVEFSLRVFGHQHTVEEKNCFDTKNEVPFSKDNRTQMAFRLADIRPLGVTPIAYALQQAADYDLVDEVRNAYSIILITDGGESCGGDICEVMQELMKKKVFFKPYIVSLENDPGLRTTYSCMGDYLQVTHNADISPAVSTIVSAFRPALKITKAEYKQLQSIAANVPSILKTNIPIRVPETADTVKPVPPAVVETQAITPIKTFADTSAIKPVVIKKPPSPVITPKEPPHDTVVIAPPPHHIIVSEAPPRPPAKKMALLEAAPLRSFNIMPPPAEKAKTVEPQFSLPPVASAVVTPPPHKIDRLAAAPLRSFNVIPAAPGKAVTADAALTLPPVVSATEPVPQKISRLQPAPLRSFNINAATPEKAKMATAQVSLPSIPDVKPDTVAAVHKLSHLKPARLKTFNVLFIVEDRIFNQRRVPALPAVNYDGLVKRVDSKIPIPLKQPVPPGKRGGYTVETEDAKETSLAIYFTDGMGKFYTTTPQMVMVTPRINKVIKKFYRTVDAAGEPDPQTDIPEGTYDIAVSGSRSLIIHDVDIVKNKKNKLIIKVKKCSLKFAYLNAPDRPVKEFSAVVTERDKPNGKVVLQKCTDELMYEMGNYHLVINAFPQIVRNVDLDMDDEVVITILQPGFAKFTPDAKTHVTSLYVKEGDKYLPFHTLDLNDTASQHLQMQPGEYQAHFRKGPGGSAASEKVVPFIIKATQETEVILK